MPPGLNPCDALCASGEFPRGSNESHLPLQAPPPTLTPGRQTLAVASAEEALQGLRREQT